MSAPPTHTAPPWSGWIATTRDALLILEAARRGLIPRVTRRLADAERKMIASGSVFVFDEDESGIKRWTDGYFWSPSRILGNFLLYRETERRGEGHGKRGKRGREEEGEGDEDEGELDGEEEEGEGEEVEGGKRLSRPKTAGVDRHRERTLVGSLTNSYKFKADGLMKKVSDSPTFGLRGTQHLISYYSPADVAAGRLRPPSSLPELASLAIAESLLERANFRVPPRVEIGADGVRRYLGEGEEEAAAGVGADGPHIRAGVGVGLARAGGRGIVKGGGAGGRAAGKRAGAGAGKAGAGARRREGGCYVPSLPIPNLDRRH
ncbi:Gti1/Pac2 family-domain-containing protein [Mycena maculata]|uniref:Gti1/Pac2 family-domain-containing protein n=1 Tax=Mycena maculata TaxID=230809 RepID=A0AAD7HF85_9AGAR|nr:Gti1/Pac2 family-domain-containing protein [Mycena maculata]